MLEGSNAAVYEAVSAGPGELPESTGISRAKKLITDRYTESLSLEEIIAVSGLSRFRFLRLFKRETGLSPHEFLIWYRVERAKQLLADQVSVLQTAMDTGFFDQSHFCRHFKRITGISPGAYSKSTRTPHARYEAKDK
jgi:AraC-like DNA-binding protein